MNPMHGPKRPSDFLVPRHCRENGNEPQGRLNHLTLVDSFSGTDVQEGHPFFTLIDHIDHPQIAGPCRIRSRELPAQRLVGIR